MGPGAATKGGHVAKEDLGAVKYKPGTREHRERPGGSNSGRGTRVRLGERAAKTRERAGKQGSVTRAKGTPGNVEGTPGANRGVRERPREQTRSWERTGSTGNEMGTEKQEGNKRGTTESRRGIFN